MRPQQPEPCSSYVGATSSDSKNLTITQKMMDHEFTESEETCDSDFDDYDEDDFLFDDEDDDDMDSPGNGPLTNGSVTPSYIHQSSSSSVGHLSYPSSSTGSIASVSMQPTSRNAATYLCANPPANTPIKQPKTKSKAERKPRSVTVQRKRSETLQGNGIHLNAAMNIMPNTTADASHFNKLNEGSMLQQQQPVGLVEPQTFYQDATAEEKTRVVRQRSVSPLPGIAAFLGGCSSPTRNFGTPTTIDNKSYYPSATTTTVPSTSANHFPPSSYNDSYFEPQFVASTDYRQSSFEGSSTNMNSYFGAQFSQTCSSPHPTDTNIPVDSQKNRKFSAKMNSNSMPKLEIQSQNMLQEANGVMKGNNVANNSNYPDYGSRTSSRSTPNSYQSNGGYSQYPSSSLPSYSSSHVSTPLSAIQVSSTPSSSTPSSSAPSSSAPASVTSSASTQERKTPIMCALLAAPPPSSSTTSQPNSYITTAPIGSISNSQFVKPVKAKTPRNRSKKPKKTVVPPIAEECQIIVAELSSDRANKMISPGQKPPVVQLSQISPMVRPNSVPNQFVQQHHNQLYSTQSSPSGSYHPSPVVGSSFYQMPQNDRMQSPAITAPSTSSQSNESHSSQNFENGKQPEAEAESLAGKPIIGYVPKVLPKPVQLAEPAPQPPSSYITYHTLPRRQPVQARNSHPPNAYISIAVPSPEKLNQRPNPAAPLTPNGFTAIKNYEGVKSLLENSTIISNAPKRSANSRKKASSSSSSKSQEVMHKVHIQSGDGPIESINMGLETYQKVMRTFGNKQNRESIVHHQEGGTVEYFEPPPKKLAVEDQAMNTMQPSKQLSTSTQGRVSSQMTYQIQSTPLPQQPRAAPKIINNMPTEASMPVDSMQAAPVQAASIQSTQIQAVPFPSAPVQPAPTPAASIPSAPSQSRLYRVQHVGPPPLLQRPEPVRSVTPSAGPNVVMTVPAGPRRIAVPSRKPTTQLTNSLNGTNTEVQKNEQTQPETIVPTGPPSMNDQVAEMVVKIKKATLEALTPPRPGMLSQLRAIPPVQPIRSLEEAALVARIAKTPQRAAAPTGRRSRPKPVRPIIERVESTRFGPQDATITTQVIPSPTDASQNGNQDYPMPKSYYEKCAQESIRSMQIEAPHMSVSQVVHRLRQNSLSRKFERDSSLLDPQNLTVLQAVEMRNREERLRLGQNLKPDGWVQSPKRGRPSYQRSYDLQGKPRTSYTSVHAATPQEMNFKKQVIPDKPSTQKPMDLSHNARLQDPALLTLHPIVSPQKERQPAAGTLISAPVFMPASQDMTVEEYCTAQQQKHYETDLKIQEIVDTVSSRTDFADVPKKPKTKTVRIRHVQPKSAKELKQNTQKMSTIPEETLREVVAMEDQRVAVMSRQRKNGYTDEAIDMRKPLKEQQQPNGEQKTGKIGKFHLPGEMWGNKDKPEDGSKSVDGEDVYFENLKTRVATKTQREQTEKPVQSPQMYYPLENGKQNNNSEVANSLNGSSDTSTSCSFGSTKTDQNPLEQQQDDQYFDNYFDNMEKDAFDEEFFFESEVIDQEQRKVMKQEKKAEMLAERYVEMSEIYAEQNKAELKQNMSEEPEQSRHMYQMIQQQESHLQQSKHLQQNKTLMTLQKPMPIPKPITKQIPKPVPMPVLMPQTQTTAVKPAASRKRKAKPEDDPFYVVNRERDISDMIDQLVVNNTMSSALYGEMSPVIEHLMRDQKLAEPIAYVDDALNFPELAVLLTQPERKNLSRRKSNLKREWFEYYETYNDDEVLEGVEEAEKLGKLAQAHLQAFTDEFLRRSSVPHLTAAQTIAAASEIATAKVAESRAKLAATKALFNNDGAYATTAAAADIAAVNAASKVQAATLKPPPAKRSRAKPLAKVIYQQFEAMQPVQPIQQIQPVQSFEQVQAAHQRQTPQNQPIEQSQHVQPVQPFQQMHHDHQTQQVQQMQPIHQNQQAQSFQQMQPIQSFQQMEQIQHVDHAQQIQQVQPMQPVQQTQQVQHFAPPTTKDVPQLEQVQPAPTAEVVKNNVDDNSALDDMDYTQAFVGEFNLNDAELAELVAGDFNDMEFDLLAGDDDIDFSDPLSPCYDPAFKEKMEASAAPQNSSEPEEKMQQPETMNVDPEPVEKRAASVPLELDPLHDISLNMDDPLFSTNFEYIQGPSTAPLPLQQSDNSEAYGAMTGGNRITQRCYSAPDHPSMFTFSDEDLQCYGEPYNAPMMTNEMENYNEHAASENNIAPGQIDYSVTTYSNEVLHENHHNESQSSSQHLNSSDHFSQSSNTVQNNQQVPSPSSSNHANPAAYNNNCYFDPSSFDRNLDTINNSKISLLNPITIQYANDNDQPLENGAQKAYTAAILGLDFTQKYKHGPLSVSISFKTEDKSIQTIQTDVKTIRDLVRRTIEANESDDKDLSFIDTLDNMKDIDFLLAVRTDIAKPLTEPKKAAPRAKRTRKPKASNNQIKYQYIKTDEQEYSITSTPLENGYKPNQNEVIADQTNGNSSQQQTNGAAPDTGLIELNTTSNYVHNVRYSTCRDKVPEEFAFMEDFLA